MRTPNEIGWLFQNNQGSDGMQSVLKTHPIQTSPFSHQQTDVLEEAEGGGEEGVEEEEH